MIEVCKQQINYKYIFVKKNLFGVFRVQNLLIWYLNLSKKFIFIDNQQQFNKKLLKNSEKY